jgi:hypothetical protein
MQITFWIALAALAIGVGLYLGRVWGEGACRSRIYMSDGVVNDNRQAWNESEGFYPAYIKRAGRWEPALFLHTDINEAIRRAAKPHNADDMPPRLRWWQRWAPPL